MYLISGNITSNVTGNLLVITGNGNIGKLPVIFEPYCSYFACKLQLAM